MSEQDQDEKRVDDALRVLGEHFDSIQIFATRVNDNSEGGGTVHISKGIGNWFARYGHAKMWCNRSEGDEFHRDVKFKQENE